MAGVGVCRRLGGKREALNEHCIEKERKISSQGQDVFCIREHYQALREYNVSAIGCHM